MQAFREDAPGIEAKPWQPADAVAHAIRGHLRSFEAWVEAAGSGEPPRFAVAELERAARCGVLAHGFVRGRCGPCDEERLVGFSCKGRGVCPRCGGRRMSDEAARWVDRVLPVVAWRQ
jgi:hypothetical protein